MPTHLDLDKAEQELAELRARLADYERNTIKRDESVPRWADFWTKDGYGSFWYSADNHPHSEPAPDLRPDTEGPITLPIVDLG